MWNKRLTSRPYTIRVACARKQNNREDKRQSYPSSSKDNFIFRVHDVNRIICGAISWVMDDENYISPT